ncbi:hypothetical protein QPX96_06480 [Limosilactobacillus fermentum]|nr:hypothetical protein [Limosilactobacillus fermentum]
MVSHQLTISLDEDAFRALEKRAQSERRPLEEVAASMRPPLARSRRPG